MTPAELRNLNFAQLRDSLAERRRDVYRAFCDHGPATTFELSEKCGIGILTVRPRSTELAELGLLCKAGERVENGKRVTVYAATDHKTWTEWRDKTFPADGQLQMGLNANGALTT